MYAVADVETTNIKHGETPKTKFWGFADDTGYYRFETTAKFLKWLRTIPPRTILHHSNFDVIQLLVDGCKQLKILRSHNGRLIRCSLEHHTLLNSFSVFPVSLAKIFTAFGYQKTDLKQLSKRNYEDCVNGLKCFKELDSIFVKLCGVSPLAKGTIASTGFAAAELVAGKMPKDLRFLSAYRGGRVEVFDTRETKAGKYDIHSSYPYSFLDAPKRGTLLHVKVKTKDWFCPFFEANCNDLLLFPNGIFTTWFYDDVFQRYIEPHAEKTTIKILSRHKIDFSWLKQLEHLINDVYRKKSDSAAAIQLVCKLLLNSLYGRIGLRGETERARILDYKPDGDVAIHFLGRKRYLVFDTIHREPRSNFPFASYITDNARGRLFSAFKKNNALYGDTDSILTPVARSKFTEKTGDGIGHWNYEWREKFQAVNVKDYSHNCADCHGKGCSKCDKGKIHVRKGGDSHIEWTLKRFARGLDAAEVVRERIQTLRKRRVLPDGRTEPHTVNH